MIKKSHLAVSILIITHCIGFRAFAQRQMEALGRGVVAVRSTPHQVFVSWRLLGTEPGNTAFNIYRKAGNGAPVLLNKAPLTTVTWFVDSLADATTSNTWLVKPVLNGKEQATVQGSYTLQANTSVHQYLSIPLQQPAGSEIMGKEYTYSANDASVGDLDGDGEYEIIVKWEPSNDRNPPQPGFTGEQILECL